MWSHGWTQEKHWAMTATFVCPSCRCNADCHPPCRPAALMAYHPSSMPGMPSHCACRPAYLALANLREAFPRVPVAAVTATATAAVIKEMQEILALKQPKVFIGSFNRSNIQYLVRHKELIGDGSDSAVLQVCRALLVGATPKTCTVDLNMSKQYSY